MINFNDEKLGKKTTFSLGTKGKRTIRRKKVGYNFPALTIFQTPVPNSGKEYQFQLNKLALDLLEITEQTPFVKVYIGDARDSNEAMSGRVFLLHTNIDQDGKPVPHEKIRGFGSKQQKALGKFSNAKLHNELNKLDWIDTSNAGVILELARIEHSGNYAACEVRPLSEENAASIMNMPAFEEVEGSEFSEVPFPEEEPADLDSQVEAQSEETRQTNQW